MLEEIFSSNGYIDIKDMNDVESFRDDRGNLLEGLEHIYLRNNYAELFLVFNMTSLTRKTIKTRIKEIEECTLTYINFEWQDEKTYKYIKYNTTLIIRCNSELWGENNSIIKEEKSTTICRKIFLFEDKDKEMELNYLPFYFTELKNSESLELKNLYEDLIIDMKKASDFLEKIRAEEIKNV